jgi:hypothetical protein
MQRVEARRTKRIEKQMIINSAATSNFISDKIYLPKTGALKIKVYLLIPNLEQNLFWNRDSLIWIFFWRLPITEQGLPVSEWGLYFFLSFESRTTRSQKRGMIPISERGCQYSLF